MSAAMRLAAALLVATMAAPVESRGQDVPVVFVHGAFSSGDAWRATATRLANVLAITPHVVDLPSVATIETQAGQLQAAKGWLPPSTLAVAHSQGGLVARQWSRTRNLDGLITLGTPHQGALLSQRGLDVIHFNYLAYNLIGLASSWGAGTEYAWITAALSSYLSAGLQLTWGTAAGLASIVAVNGVAPVAPELVPGSAFLLGLNGNPTREAAAIRRRVGLSFTADQYWRAGVGVALAPDQREWVWAVMLVLPPTLEYAAAYLDVSYPTNLSVVSLAMQLRNIAGTVRELDPLWCWAVTNDRTCRTPHDGIVAVGSQAYPGGVNFAVYGPAHTQETERSDRPISDALTGVMGVAVRTTGGGGGGGGTSYGGGTRLYADQQLTSPDGTVGLRYQSDGNLVLYRSGAPVWASGTQGFWAGYMEMQTDGNLVVYDAGGAPRWASDTSAPGAVLRLLNAGVATIVDPSGTLVWSTGVAVP
ncbi:MAG: hypothetical protein AB7O28_12745 [Vicinamibacterales bacterium]